ncbi:NADP-dependent oxidoreductase [Exiguobacterium sp. s91]|uniref:NADP-dependent oxidoreductase n=1 Tax=Exiguobacterium sp. s91 TaxID=2751199 RepID=UPI001BE668BD|nr:NADP-dependent oxidoreductase [Exiguobacterium sp. s91]
MSEQRIVLAARPNGKPTGETFRYESFELAELKEGQVALESLYISVDPYMRGRMNDARSYSQPFEIDEPIHGGVVARVIESKSEGLKSGDVVVGMLDWATKAVVDAKTVRKIDEQIAPISTALGVLGMTGMTAYFGLLDIGNPQPGETVVVSAAAGAVGSIVGQIAKIKGARVVGIAGSDEKLQHLKADLGFDEVINYKTEDIREALDRTCPDGIDVYFENVGGEIGDAVLDRLNPFARVPVCGAISGYNAQQDIGPRVQSKLIIARARMQGFLVGDYGKRFKEAAEQLGQWVSEGKLQYEETIFEGFDRVPNAFLGLFDGSNTGKLLVKVK